MGKLFNSRNSQVSSMVQLDSITLGTVIATNDPHQMGRIKVLCPALGDDPNDDEGSNLPWASFVSPLGGMVNATFNRGPHAGSSAKGPIAYGMWGVPKRGSTVLICCVDGNPYYRVWMGCVFDQGSVNTLPHGRFFYKNVPGGEPEGPLDSYESPIEPTYSNLTAAFKNRQNNYEWRTRGADYSAGGNAPGYTDLSPSDIPDETSAFVFRSKDGKAFGINNGYTENRMDGQKDEESSIYSWTSPGFHSISMDDRPEACKIKIRSVGGSQLIIDDTNERIYINTARGENWIEMDWNGNIDMHGRNLSFHAQKHINFTAEETIRMFAKDGVHLYSNKEINIEAETDINTTAHKDVKTRADKTLSLHSGADTNIKADGEIIETGTNIHLNGKPAQSANPKPSKWTLRLPSHEPFARVITKNDFTHAPEFEYNDKSVGVVERGDTFARGMYWRR